MPASAQATHSSTLSARDVRKLNYSLDLRRALRCHYLAGATAMLLASTAADALELGEARVQSALGDPLHVEIPVKVAANENLRSECLSLVSGNAGLPSFSNATATLRSGTIHIRSSQVVREPLLGLNLRVNCTGAPHLIRSYQLFVDPRPLTAPIASAPNVARSTPDTAVRREPVPRATSPRVSKIARGLEGTEVTGGSRYEVRVGDTLSGIAARIDDRDVSLWQAVDQIFAANPHAFDNGDVNLLRAGATLVIPAMGGAVAEPVAAKPAPVTPPTIAPVVSENLDTAFTAIDTPSIDVGADVSDIASPAAADTQPAPDAALTSPAGDETANSAFDVRSPFVVRDDVTPIAPRAAEAREPDTAARTTPGWLTGLVSIGSALVLTLVLVLFMRRRKPVDMPDFIDSPLPAKGTEVPRARVADLEDTIEESAMEQWQGDETDAFPQGVDENGYTDSLSTIDENSDSFSLDVATNREALDLAFDAPASTENVDLDVGNAPPPTSASETGVTMTRQSTSESDITLADLNMLTEDYEAELTATQQLNEELATAVANLKAADAKVNGDTNEMPAADFDEAAETAFLEEVEVPDELRWDDQTRANAQLMTEELLEDATFTVAVEGDADTVEMPARGSQDAEIYDETAGLDTVSSPAVSKDESQAADDDEWAAFTRAASGGDRS